MIRMKNLLKIYNVDIEDENECLTIIQKISFCTEENQTL